MNQRFRTVSSSGDWRALPVMVLGILIAIAPVVAVPFPEAGALTFVIRFAQVVGIVVGAGVAFVGYRSYRTGDLRPSAALGLSVVGVGVVGVVGNAIEQTSGLIPLWVWGVAAIAVVVMAVLLAYRVMDIGPETAHV